MDVPANEELLELLRSAFVGEMPAELQEQLQGMSESEIYAACFTAVLRAGLNPANYPEGADRTLAPQKEVKLKRVTRNAMEKSIVSFFGVLKDRIKNFDFQEPLH